VVNIYGLRDPITEECRYIGLTRGTLQARLKGHVDSAHSLKTHRDRWINSLLKNGKRPEIFMLEMVSENQAGLAEQAWIHYLRREKCSLTNATEGGEVSPMLTPEVAAKHGQTIRGRKLSTEHRAKISRGLLGNQHTLGKKANAETRAKMSLVRKGRKHTSDCKHCTALMGNQHTKGFHPTAETRAKMSAAAMGNQRAKRKEQ